MDLLGAYVDSDDSPVKSPPKTTEEIKPISLLSGYNDSDDSPVVRKEDEPEERRPVTPPPSSPPQTIKSPPTIQENIQNIEEKMQEDRPEHDTVAEMAQTIAVEEALEELLHDSESNHKFPPLDSFLPPASTTSCPQALIVSSSD